MGDSGSSVVRVLLLNLKSRPDLISRPIELVVGFVLIQSQQLGNVGWGTREDVKLSWKS